MKYFAFYTSPDYENPDGSWTRYPAKLPIDQQVEKQSAAETMVVQYAARIKELEAFVKKFLDNFEDCPICEIGLDAAGQICSRCEGTEKQIDSRGVLFVELPEEARALLKGGA